MVISFRRYYLAIQYINSVKADFHALYKDQCDYYQNIN